MAHVLKANNILGTPSIVSPSGTLASAANFIDPYTYAIQYEPDKISDLHLQKGKGKITKFSQLIGNESSFASDQVIHTEMGDLHTVSESVTVSGNVYTSTTDHGLRVTDTIMISDGTVERYATVTAITSTKIFEALHKGAGAHGLTGTLTVFVDGNSWGKGEGNFTEGHEWTPQYIHNYPQIVKEFYKTNESDMAHLTWIKAPMFPGGEGWFNVDMGRTGDLYDNKLEIIQTLGRRADAASDSAVAGYAQGMKGIIQQIEERGNIGNEYLTTLADYSAVAKRIKQQGGTTSYTVWCDHTQMAHNRVMLANLNGAFDGGTNYGTFQNGKDMALKLDFQSVLIDGITFHFTSWNILDDLTLLGSAKFAASSIACVFIPSGNQSVLEDGNTVSRPHLGIKYRRKGNIDRYKKVKIFGGAIGTPHKVDTMEVHYETEQTNQLVGANQFFVVRRGTGIYTGL